MPVSPLPSPRNQNRSSFQNVVFSIYLEFHKPSDSSSELFAFNFDDAAIPEVVQLYSAYNHKRATAAKCRVSHSRYRGTAQQ
jgi:hypothetical protein